MYQFLASVFIAAMALQVLFTSQSSAQMIVGHRGASHDAPENTISAFNLAWEQDADGIEGDFYLTADGQIVCIHDATTGRTAQKDISVTKSTLAELRVLEVGHWKDAKWRGEVIPTFAEVLATVPKGKTFVIELKSTVEIVEPLKGELDRLDHSGIKLLIISFDEQTIKACKELMPQTRAHWLTSFKQNASSGAWQPSAATITGTLRRCDADGVGMQGNTEVIDRAFVQSLTDGGCREFHVWTIDNPEDARYFAGLGAVGITTNRPAFK